ncbi:hypothetical protein FBULB1_7923 [Fusarium bulbicola]|nr:hypothetical protein FBULB1_7923 [Fusarium bulbicola]
MSPIPSSKLWTGEQKFYFMELLYEAHRSRELEPGKGRELKALSDSFSNRLKERFPSCKWDSKKVEFHYKRVVNDYRRRCQVKKKRGAGEMKTVRGETEMKDTHLSGPGQANPLQSYAYAGLQAPSDVFAFGKTVTPEVNQASFSGYVYASDGDASVPECPLTQAKGNIVGACSLNKMPNELLYMIGSYLTHQESILYSAVSKRFRNLLGAQHFTAIRLSGTLEGLAKELRFLLELLESKVDVFNQTRHATFHITSIHGPKDPGPFCNALLTSDLIGSCIKTIKGLHDVTFDLDLRGESSCFHEHFQSQQKWKKPCSVIFQRADRKAFETIIHNFEPGIVKAVQLPMEISMTYYGPLKTGRHPLKALHAWIPSI